MRRVQPRIPAPSLLCRCRWQGKSRFKGFFVYQSHGIECVVCSNILTAIDEQISGINETEIHFLRPLKLVLWF